MTTLAVLAPDIFPQLVNQTGTAPAVGFKLFTYQAGTSIKQPTYLTTFIDPSNQNTNPIITASDGSYIAFLDPSLVYKFVLAPSNDTDPPSSPIKTIDNIYPSVGVSSLYPISPAEAGISPINTIFDYDIVFRFGAKGDGINDDGPAINNMIQALSQPTGTYSMKIGYMPKPIASYVINTPIVNQPGVAIDYNGEDISPSGTQFATLPLYMQMSIEGTPPNNYKSAVAYAQDVALNNGALASPFRYWTIIGSVNVPTGATVAPGVVTNDHLGVRGQAINNANNTRIWGVVGVAVAKQPGAGLTDSQMGSVIGGEFDINNETGTNIVGYDRNLNYVAVQAAMGGAFNCMSAYQVQVAGSGQFISGLTFKGSSIAQYGLYFDDVAPSIAAINISDAYTGGGVLSVKNGLDAVYLRNAASNDFVGRIRADTAAMEIIGGPGTGSGTFGIYFVNHANSAIHGGFTDGGTFQGQVLAHLAVAKVVNSTTIPISPGGQFTCSDSNPTTVTAFTGGELGGRFLTMLFTTANTTISTSAAKLKGGTNANPSANSSMTFEMDGSGVWWETGRSF